MYSHKTLRLRSAVEFKQYINSPAERAKVLLIPVVHGPIAGDDYNLSAYFNTSILYFASVWISVQQSKKPSEIVLTCELIN